MEQRGFLASLCLPFNTKWGHRRGSMSCDLSSTCALSPAGFVSRPCDFEVTRDDKDLPVKEELASARLLSDQVIFASQSRFFSRASKRHELKQLVSGWGVSSLSHEERR
ncbi:uncharacterized protein FN964_008221 isoform 1-T1 [Alca torda]